MNFIAADAFVALHGDDAQLLADAQASGGKAGDIAGKSFGASLKKAAGAAIGAGIGYAVGATLAGANDLDAASRRLFADTGLVGDAAKAAEHALADMYRNNIQGFDEIGATMAVVRNELHLTGDEADFLTERILKYATASGQAAPDAAKGLTAVLKAFNLTAADSNAVMDALIISHQKWGGSIAGNVESLAAMGPALVAANMNWGQGIALLNMFTAAGVDAAAVPVALARALSKVKSPAELQKLIADISATTDPFLRAQKAADLFGAKAGPRMAAALAQGSGGLDQFAVSMTGTGAATDQAAANIEQGFGEHFRMIMKNAEGQLAEFGTSFGDLIGIAQLFGPAFTKALLAGLGGLAGLAVVQGAIAMAAGAAETLYLQALFAGDALSGAAAAAWEKVAGSQAMLKVAGLAGGKAGTAFGIAAGAVIPLAIVAAVAEAATLLEDPLHKLALQIHDAIFGQRGPLDDVGAWLDSLPWPIGPVGAPDWAAGAADASAGGKKIGAALNTALLHGPAPTTLESLRAQWLQAGKDNVKALATGAAAATGTAEATAYAIGATSANAQARGYQNWQGAIRKTISDQKAFEIQQAKDAVAGVRAAIIAGKPGIVSAWRDALTERNKVADDKDQILINNAEIVAQKKILADKKSTAAEKAQARITLRQLRDDNAAMLIEQAGYGTRAQQIAKTKALLTSKDLLAGLRSKDPDVRQHWIDVKTAAETQLEALRDEAQSLGRDTVANYAYGMKLGQGDVIKVVRGIATIFRNGLEIKSPAKEGPLSLPGGPAGLGLGLVKDYAKGMVAGVPYVAAARDASALAAILRMPGQPFHGSSPALMASAVPAFYAAPAMSVAAPAASSIVPRGTSSGGGGRDGNTYNVTVNNPEPRPAPQDIGRVLRRTAALGMAR